MWVYSVHLKSQTRSWERHRTRIWTQDQDLNSGPGSELRTRIWTQDLQVSQCHIHTVKMNLCDAQSEVKLLLSKVKPSELHKLFNWIRTSGKLTCGLWSLISYWLNWSSTVRVYLELIRQSVINKMNKVFIRERERESECDLTFYILLAGLICSNASWSITVIPCFHLKHWTVTSN